MQSLFESIREEMPGYLSAAIGTVEPGGGLKTHSSGALDLAEGGDALHAMIRGYASTYRSLGGRMDLGSNDEVLISASRAYLLIKVDHGSGRFLAVLLSSSGNIGYLRFKMRAWIRELAADRG